MDARPRGQARYGSLADRFRPKLIELLGEENGKAVKYAESFEICEYGSQPTREELMTDLSVLRRSVRLLGGERSSWLGDCLKQSRRRRGRVPRASCPREPVPFGGFRSTMRDQRGGVAACSGPPQRRR